MPETGLPRISGVGSSVNKSATLYVFSLLAYVGAKGNEGRLTFLLLFL